MKITRYIFIMFSLWGISSQRTNAENRSTSPYVEGRGYFAVQKGDGSGLIKKQLKYLAFKDILSKEIIRIGQNPTPFWEKYEKRFQFYFAPIEKKLKKQLLNSEDLTPEKKEIYRKSLRRKYLYAQIRFGNLNRMIKSYVEKKYGRSKDNPQVRYLDIIASVDRQRLRRWYFRMTKNEQREAYRRIFLSTNFKLIRENWNGLGVAEKDDFTEVVRKYWKKWFDEHREQSSEEVVLMSENMLEDLQKYLWVPRREVKSGNYQNSNQPPRKHFTDGLWIHLNLSIHKMSENITTRQKIFRMTGSFLFMDINNRKFIDHKMLFLPNKTYDSSDMQKLSSALAQQAWGLPLPHFQELKYLFKQRPRYNIQRMGLAFKNLENIKNMYQIQELLVDQGINFNLSPTIVFYNGSQGIIELGYRRKSEKLLPFLESLHRKKINPDTILLKSESYVFTLQKIQGVLDEY